MRYREFYFFNVLSFRKELDYLIKESLEERHFQFGMTDSPPFTVWVIKDVALPERIFMTWDSQRGV